MKRREFLQKSSLASSLFFVPNFVRAFERIDSKKLGYKKLVIIQLSGGNDGLNTIIPIENDIYYNARPKIAIPKNEVLTLNDQLGFHPSLKGLKKLYDKGYVSILNNVGYPNPNRSHFRSTDIWQTASESNEYLSSGWLGRYLDHYQSTSYAGIEIDDSLSLILKGENRNGIATKNPRILYGNVQTPYFKKVLNYQTQEHLSEHNLGYLYKTMIEAASSAKYLHETTKKSKSSMTYPNNAFAKQLKTVAEFINSGIHSKVYYVSMGGFDTHAGQLNKHRNLLQMYGDAVSVFVEDLTKNDKFKDTLIVTFSEFGRRVKQNASNGTDHGAANQVFIIGEHLKKAGLYNATPDLTKLDNNGDLMYTIDFREIYATLIDYWLDADHQELLGKSFSKLTFI